MRRLYLLGLSQAAALTHHHAPRRALSRLRTATTTTILDDAPPSVDAWSNSLPADGLDRFDAFCAHVLAGGNVRETNETTLQGPRGVQVVSQYYFAGLAARPWWYGAATTGLEGPAWVGALTAARATIAGELRGLVERDAIEYRAGHELGNDFDVWHVTREAAPRTAEALEALGCPFKGARSVLLCRIAPGSKLMTHSDLYNYVLTAHLPLFMLPRTAPPAATWLHLDEVERRTGYEAFKRMLETDPAHEYPPFERRGVAGMVFKTSGFEAGGGATHEPWFDLERRPCPASLVDTSFTHTAFNDHATDDIYFLHFDVWHPELTTTEIEAIRKLDEVFRANWGAPEKQSF